MKLAFGCPYYGPTPPRVVISQVGAVMNAAREHPFVLNVGTERTPHITACERILKRAVESNCDALFWTEHDCVLPKDAISKLVLALEVNPEFDIATGITFMRYHPYHPMIAHYAGVLTQEILDANDNVVVTNMQKDKPVLGEEHFLFHTSIDTGAPNFEVDATSLNCVLFRRRALEVMAAIDHPFDTGHFTTPDFALFARLRGKLRTLCVSSLLTIHLGEQEAIGFEQWVEAMEGLAKAGAAERVA